MTVPFWCLFVAVLLPLLIAPMGSYFRNRQFGSIDNRNPRAQQADLEGAGARVMAAQANAWEALAIFAPAVIVNHLAGGDPGTAATLSLVFIAMRVLHPIFYLADLHIMRSAVWMIGFVCVVGLFVRAG